MGVGVEYRVFWVGNSYSTSRPSFVAGIGVSARGDDALYTGNTLAG